MKSRNSNFIKTSRFGNHRILPTQNLDSSSVNFNALHVQTLNNIDITLEAKKQEELTQKVNILEARIIKLEGIINLLVNV